MKTAISALIFLWLACPIANAEVPRPEHPRPDAFRENWLSLNGPWQFEIDKAGDGEARGLISGKDLAADDRRALLSGKQTLGPGPGQQGILHTLLVSPHVRPARRDEGQTRSAALRRRRLQDVGLRQRPIWPARTPAKTPPSPSKSRHCCTMAPNELVVRVFDDLRSGLQPGGKQAPVKSEGCIYTRTTGIWQPVWLEAVGSSFVESLSIVPDPDHGRVLIEAAVNGPDAGLKLDGRGLGRRQTGRRRYGHRHLAQPAAGAQPEREEALGARLAVSLRPETHAGPRQRDHRRAAAATSACGRSPSTAGGSSSTASRSSSG